MAEYRGMAYLRRKLTLKRRRFLTRYTYYEMKNEVRRIMDEFKNSTPDRSDGR